MSASWLLMFIQPRIFKALPQWPLFVHSWCLWKLLALLKMFLEKEKPTTTKKMISFLWVSVIQVLYPVGNNFYLNVLNHRNVKGQHKKFVFRLTFILKFFFFVVYALICFLCFVLSEVSYCTFLPIRVVLQPFIRVVSECQFVRIIELSACCWVETRTVRLFTVITWRWLNCLLF